MIVYTMNANLIWVDNLNEYPEEKSMYLSTLTRANIVENNIDYDSSSCSFSTQEDFKKLEKILQDNNLTDDEWNNICYVFIPSGYIKLIKEREGYTPWEVYRHLTNKHYNEIGRISGLVFIYYMIEDQHDLKIDSKNTIVPIKYKGITVNREIIKETKVKTEYKTTAFICMTSEEEVRGFATKEELNEFIGDHKTKDSKIKFKIFNLVGRIEPKVKDFLAEEGITL